mmetsp:Transcript_53933/g.126522  ORF Transcript_53933/g.126522 Transcript_53933/m.126522 type:complete len:268 (-) Transcript_53933:106-909(-)
MGLSFLWQCYFLDQDVYHAKGHNQGIEVVAPDEALLRIIEPALPQHHNSCQHLADIEGQKDVFDGFEDLRPVDRLRYRRIHTQNFFSICRSILHLDHEDDRVDQNNEAREHIQWTIGHETPEPAPQSLLWVGILFLVRSRLCLDLLRQARGRREARTLRLDLDLHQLTVAGTFPARRGRRLLHAVTPGCCAGGATEQRHVLAPAMKLVQSFLLLVELAHEDFVILSNHFLQVISVPRIGTVRARQDLLCCAARHRATLGWIALAGAL